MTDDDAKRLILSRRARFVAAALASAGLVVSTANCGGETDEDGKSDAAAGGSGGTGGTPQPCLEPAGGSGGTGGWPEPCLGMPAGGSAGYAGAAPCLSAPAGGSGGQPEPDAALDASESD